MHGFESWFLCLYLLILYIYIYNGFMCLPCNRVYIYFFFYNKHLPEKHYSINLFHYHGFLQQRRHCFRWLCSNRQPFSNGWGIQVGLLVHWIIPSQVLQRSSITALSLINCYDSVEWKLLTPHSCETNRYFVLHHKRSTHHW